jgi:two-component system response regulator (stage 0 sporulation protein A)
MSINEKIDLLIRFVTAENAAEQELARKALRAHGGAEATEGFREADVKTAAEEFLTEVGVPSNLFGYEYLATAIVALIEDPEQGKSLMKGLYGHVAKLCNTTGSRVERTCRHAIERAFERCDYEMIEGYFGCSINQNKGNPTVGEFVTRAAVIVRRRVQNA